MTPHATAMAGVSLRPLRVIATEGGPVLHMLRADAPEFRTFGEVYFSLVEAGGVKAWKCHTRQTQHFAVPSGRMRLALFDGREGSPTRGSVLEVVLGRPDAYALLTIPPGIWYGFGALDGREALLCNCADMPHDPQESLRLPRETEDIPYTWQPLP